jgi:tetratricopeptide (TPR) repeat protein
VLALMISLVIGLVAVFAVLPRLINGPSPPAPAEIPVEESTQAPENSTPIPPTDPPSMDDGLRRTVEAALGEGGSALDARDPQTAATAFRRAAALDPGNTAAEQGLNRAEHLATLMLFENRALSAEKRGEIEAATAAARRALDLDPNSQSARGVADRMAAKLRQKSYQGLITRGLTALENEKYEKALEAFTAAGERQPSAPEVADGLARARSGLTRQVIAGHLARATEAEDAENWQQAVTEYRAAQVLDPDLGAARTGFERSEDRLELAQRMIYHLENPKRLATTEVIEEATELAEEAKNVSKEGPRHLELVQRLDALIREVSTTVPVILQSDGRTEVVLYRVGQLGAFEQQRVDLRPGTYTVIGRRSGFRDVRVKFQIRPGTPPEPIVIRCTEGI